jgi:tetratricopeptide (TPR) repeat protein
MTKAMKILKRILFILFIIGCSHLYSQVNTKELLKKNRQYLVKILAGTQDTIFRIGFGYYERATGKILTPYNNIVGFDVIKYIAEGNDTLNITGIAGVEKTADLVLLETGNKRNGKSVLEFLPQTKVGDKVFILGVEPNNIDTIHHGTITNIITTMDGTVLYNTDAKMIPGVEGGLVFNDKMKLIGITKGMYENKTIACYVIPVVFAKNMLEAPNKKLINLGDTTQISYFDIFYWRGVYAREKNVRNKVEALVLFKAALNEKPDDTNTLFQIGLTFGMLGLLDSAIYYYSESIRIDEKFVYGYVNLSVAYIYNDEFDNAITTLRKVLDIDPKNKNAILYIAYCLVKTDKLSEGIYYYKKALDIDPNDSNVLALISEAYYLSKRYKDAITTANKALKINPNEVDALYVLGVTNIALEKKEEAQKYYNILEKLDSTKATELKSKLVD